jgi:hypothetical protein
MTWSNIGELIIVNEVEELLQPQVEGGAVEGHL